MAERLRFLPAGSDAVLVELADLTATLSLFDALSAARPEGVGELVPAARTLMVRFDPRVTTPARLADAIAALDRTGRRAHAGETFDIPVVYDGEDLADVAEILGWTVEEVIRRHTQATHTVAFTGFAPGFAYMTSDDPGFDVPRRRSPRVRIPAGAVAIAGGFSGIYPSDSPGGWQLLGRTPLAMWDVGRPRPALLAPGDRVRFRDVATERQGTAAEGQAAQAAFPFSPSGRRSRQRDEGNAEGEASCVPPPHPPFRHLLPDGEKGKAMPQPQAGLRVTRADRPALFQDLGRPGRAGQGVAESGALDRDSLAEANLCVGNPPGAAALEIAFGGLALRTDRPVTLAVAGAPCPLAIRTGDGREVAAPFGRPFALDAGDALTLGLPPEGMRSYLALRGGFAVTPVLGSASTDTLAKVGPVPVVAGDVLVPANARALAVDPFRPAPKRLPKAGETVTLDIVPGPRTDWFTDKAVETLLTRDWQVTAQSSRVGMRLAGREPLERRDAAELPSEGTPPGAIQVPHSGQPVLFLADHPLTGGYPVIAVVARHHLGLAGQIPIGASIRFNALCAFDPLIRDIDR